MDQSPDSGVTEPVRPRKSEGEEASSLLRDIYFEHNSLLTDLGKELATQISDLDPSRYPRKQLA